MFDFLDASTDISRSISYTYDTYLVILSYIVASLGSFAGLLLGRHIGLIDNQLRKRGFLIAGAISMGVSVWAMHFIGMLAVTIPVPIAYDTVITAISAVPAVLASALALHVMSDNNAERRHYILAGIFIGAGIGTMHYTGMAAMQMNAEMLYDPALFVLSIIVSVFLGIAAIGSHNIERQVTDAGFVTWLRLISAGLMGLAITGMHYTAMGATYFFPGTGPVREITGLSEFWLSVSVAGITVLIVSLSLIAVLVNRRMQSVEKHLRLTETRLENVVQSLSDGFILFDDQGRLVLCNDVVKRMYPGLAEVMQPGKSYEVVLREWASIRKNLPADLDVDSYVKKCLSKIKADTTGEHFLTDEDQLQDGRWIYIRFRSVEDGGLVNTWTDVTPLKDLQNKYEKLAHQDSLTGLPNRYLFEDRLEHAWEHAKRFGKSLALLYIDLDKFKPINDSYGHEAGDTVLKEVAERLRSVARGTDTVARLGGDEFVVLLEPYGDEETARMVAERILDSFSVPFRFGKDECILEASIGIGITRVDEKEKGDISVWDRIVSNADMAMYEAKKTSGNAISLKRV